MTERTLTLVPGAAFVQLTTGDAATLLIQNQGGGDLELARAAGATPAATVTRWRYGAYWGDRGKIGDLFPGGTGARIWARSEGGTTVAIGYE
jgi:hypothetical protein